MDPIFTIPYSELLASEQLRGLFNDKLTYSIYIPASRQEKDVDLALVRREKGEFALASFQVKYSRHYEIGSRPARETLHASYCSWYNTFKIGDGADFYLLVCPIPNNDHYSDKSQEAWLHYVLCFSKNEMLTFLQNVKTRTGRPDSKFSFAYAENGTVYLIRGDQDGRFTEYSHQLLRHKREQIEECLTRRWTRT